MFNEIVSKMKEYVITRFKWQRFNERYKKKFQLITM